MGFTDRTGSTPEADGVEGTGSLESAREDTDPGRVVGGRGRAADRPGAVSLSDWLGFTERQLEALDAIFKYRYVLYGGARGGGKSYFLRKAAVAWLIYQASKGYQGVQVGLFSSTFNTLRDRQISRIAAEFPDWLGKLKDSKTASGLAFYLYPNWGGGVINLRNLDDISKYKSAEFGFIGVDELTEHPVETFDILRGSNRWAGMENPVFVGATNPDGIGNEWCRNYFIEKKYPDELEKERDQFVFIPALPKDNPHLSQSYWKELGTLPADLKRAWLEGDWYVFKGRAFKNFNRRVHVIPEREIPEYYTRIIGVDWGYRSPFCALFMARDPDSGRIYVYRELYQTELTDRQQARLIIDNSDKFDMKAIRFADPSMWKRNTLENVTSTAEVYAKNGCFLRPGDNDRLGRKRKLDRLLGNLPDGLPGILFMENCEHIIKQLELLVYDPHRSEDVDTRMEDHAYDALGYGLTNAREYRPETRTYMKEKSPYLFTEKL